MKLILRATLFTLLMSLVFSSAWADKYSDTKKMFEDAGASANTGGSSSSASGGKNNAALGSAGYNKGMSTFTITKGGAMFEASVGGQKFSYTKL